MTTAGWRAGLEAVLGPFRVGRAVHWPTLILFLLINFGVFLNSALHDPRIGYDAREHLKYVVTLSELSLPSPEDSREFFSPPLPYLAPAGLLSLGVRYLLALKAAQVLNAVLSIGVTFFLLKICLLVSEGAVLRIGTLIGLGILPVYYRTFSFIRGEPYLAFFAVISIYLAIQVFVNGRYSKGLVLVLGLALGLALLSRQWAAFLILALVVFVGLSLLSGHVRRRRVVIALFWVLVAAFLVSGWFFVKLRYEYGSFAAFNRQPAESFSLHNQPAKFYLGLGGKQLFVNPIRPSFSNELLPTLYSDVWGDYWGFFIVYGFHEERMRYVPGNRVEQMLKSEALRSRVETNFSTVGTYLGRVNLFSLLPTVLMAVALITGIYRHRKNPNPAPVVRLSLLVILFAMAGYLWFLIKYPNLEKGDTIKASYLLHIYPLLALQFGLFLEWLESKARSVYWVVLVLLIVVAAHNSFAMVTRYSMLRFL